MNNIGLMYLFNPENGNLVNTQTGKDMEYLTWEEMIQDVKKVVIGIDGNQIYSPAAENAIHPLQEWLAKEHPEVELSLHSGSLDSVKPHHTHIYLQATHYGLYIATAELNSGKTGKMVKFDRIGEGDVQTYQVKKDREHCCDFRRSQPLDTPVAQPVETSEEQKDELVQGIHEHLRQRRESKDKNHELLKTDKPLMQNHYQAGISPGRLYMMGSHTDASKSKLTKTSEVREHLKNTLEHKTRPYQVFLGFTDTSNSEANSNACKALASVLPEMVDEDWVGVEKEQDADLGLVFNGQWWIITKCRGSMNDAVGNRLVSQVLLDEACRNVNVEDAYPKGPDVPEQGSLNSYDVNWEDALQGILIIVDVQKHMGEADTQLNREMLGRVTDAILSKSLEANITVRGDTKNDAETRLIQEITNAHCVVEICGGTAYICKFRMHPELKDREIF